MLTAHLEGQLKVFLSGQAFFSLVGDKALAELVQRLEMVSFPMGEAVCAEGDFADCAYLVYSGKARVLKRGPAGRPVLLGTLHPGDFFGEQALGPGQTRTASVRAAEDLVLLRLDRAAFDKLLHDHAELAPYLERLERQRAASNFLRLATFLGALPARQVLALLDRLDEYRFPKGAVLIRQGEVGDRLYIVKSGEARVVRGEVGRETVLAYLGPGDYFGERALILGEPRFASVVAVSDVECFSLNREGFDSLLTCAPQLHEQFRRRLEQNRGAEAADRPAPEAPPAEVEARSPPPDVVWEAPPAGPAGGPDRRRSWLNLFKKRPFVAQEDETDCGAASLAMIGRHHGRRLSVAWLRDLAHVGAGGASMLGLTRAAEAAGFRWRAVSTDFAHLAGLPLPAVAHWKGYHYVVLYEVRGERALVADPAVGRLRLRRQDFEAHWTGKLLLLSPAEERRTAGEARAVGTPAAPRLALPALPRGLLVAASLASLLLALLALGLALGTRPLVDRVPRDEAAGPLGRVWRIKNP
jgi:ATP-binding cassette subfamily B protein